MLSVWGNRSLCLYRQQALYHKDAIPIANAARISYCGWISLKNTLERKVIDYLIKEKNVDFSNKKFF